MFFTRDYVNNIGYGTAFQALNTELPEQQGSHATVKKKKRLFME